MKNNLKAVFMSVRKHLLQQVGQGGGGESERLLHVHHVAEHKLSTYQDRKGTLRVQLFSYFPTLMSCTNKIDSNEAEDRKLTITPQLETIAGQLPGQRRVRL